MYALNALAAQYFATVLSEKISKNLQRAISASNEKGR